MEVQEFFNELGQTISRTAKDVQGKAENFYETQKLRNKIAKEERAIKKQMIEIGKTLYARYEAGEELDDEIKAFCEDIKGRNEAIEQFNISIADLKAVVKEVEEEVFEEDDEAEETEETEEAEESQEAQTEVPAEEFEEAPASEEKPAAEDPE